MKNLLFISMAIIFASCAVSKTKLEEGKNVNVLNMHPKDKCSMIQKVVATNEDGVEELAMNYARNLVAKAGGDSIFVTDTVPNGKLIVIHASAYRCGDDD